MERKKRMLAGLAAAGVLAGALAGGGVALADSGSPAQPAATAAAVSPAHTSAAADHAKHKRFLHRAHLGRLTLRTSATYLGLKPEDLRAQLKAGRTLAQVATAHGKSVSGLEGAIVAAVDKRIDDSKLSAARKAELTADVKANVGAFVSATHPFGKELRHLAKKAGSSASTPSSTPSASTSAT